MGWALTRAIGVAEAWQITQMIAEVEASGTEEPLDTEKHSKLINGLQTRSGARRRD